MSLGFDQEGRLNILDSQLKTELQYVGDVLNLDEMKTRVKKSNIQMGGIDSEQHKVEVDIQMFDSLPLSNFIKVYP